MKKGGRIANRPGLVKKKIRGKDGKTRTHWVRLGTPSRSGGGGSGSESQSDKNVLKAGTPDAIKTAVGLAISGVAIAGGYSVSRDLSSIHTGENKIEFVSSASDIEKASRDYDSFKPGDLIVNTFEILPGRYAEHYAVYGGKDEKGQHFVYENTRVNPYAITRRPAHVAGTPRGKFRKASIPEPTALSPKEILDRAEKLVSTPFDYDVISSNCEHLARGIIGGKFRSTQGEKLSFVTGALSSIATIPLNLRYTGRRFAAKEISSILESGKGLFEAKSAGRVDAKDLLPLKALKDPARFEKDLSRSLKGVEGEVGYAARLSAIKNYLILITACKREGREDLLPSTGEKVKTGNKERSDSPMKSKRCGRGYVPLNKKCRKGAGSASSPSVSQKERGRTLKSSTPGGAEQTRTPRTPGASPPVNAGQIAALGLATTLAGGAGSAAVLYNDLEKIGATEKEVQMVTSPEEIEAANREYDNFKVGDILVNTFQVLPGRYARHYAVYGGKDENGEHQVYETVLAGEYPTFKKRPPHEPGRPRGKFRVAEPIKGKSFSPEETIKRAESLVGISYSYDTATSNCENLARGIVEGVFSSAQGERMSAVSRGLSSVLGVIQNKNSKKGERVSASDISKMMAGGGEGLYFTGPKPGVKKDAIGSWNDVKPLKDPETFTKDLKKKLAGSSDAIRKTAVTGAVKGYLSIALALKKAGRDDLLPPLKAGIKMDARKPRKPLSKAGKLKKKIRGKDGVTRTYWVSSSAPGTMRSAEVQDRPKPSLVQELAVGTAKSIATTAIAGATVAAAKRFVSEFEKAAVTDEQKKNLRYTETGMPSEEDLKRHEEEFSPGDLIRKGFRLGHKDFFHYGVYAGKDPKTGEHMIYQTGAPGKDGAPSSAIVKAPLYSKDEVSPTVSLYEKVPSEEMYKKGTDKAPPSREEILRRAENLVGNHFDYKISQNNCESFARLVVEGKHYTTQGVDVAPDVKIIFDAGSSAVTKKGREAGATVITPEQAAAYLEEFSKRAEGESFPFSDFIRKGKQDADGEIQGLIPLHEVISEGRKSGKLSGTTQREAEKEIISRYFMLLAAINSPSRTPLKGEKKDSFLGERRACFSVCEGIRSFAG